MSAQTVQPCFRPSVACQVEVDIELNKLNALLFILEQQAGLTREQALRVTGVLEQLT
ncbi:hypothetical protein [Thiolapillus brandeum]|uniref:hypothetical protein n=1 Tax=Thiolapillus brandeum TaxID=1076588 RepID=UPI0012B52D2A|nr:hypothetical protein [Thiolapillus brandeum]